MQFEKCRPVSVTSVLLKIDGLLVEIKSISYVWVLVKQVSDFTMLVK